MEFKEFPKMARLSRECVITEKIDGTNGQIYIDEDGLMLVGSRTRWITPSDDNFGFARWCHENYHKLIKLGPGRHYGEWWGQGIQRKYGMTEKRFSLFNTLRWVEHGQEPGVIPTGDPRIVKMQEVLPECCSLVPVLYRGEFTTNVVNSTLGYLKVTGSEAAPNFMDPEGIVVYHVAGNVGFKKTIKGDAEFKGKK